MARYTSLERQPRHYGRVGAQSVAVLAQIATARRCKTSESEGEQSERRGLRNGLVVHRGATRQHLTARKMRTHREQIRSRVHDCVAHQRSLGRARDRQYERAPFAVRLERHRECTTNRPQLSGQR